MRLVPRKTVYERIVDALRREPHGAVGAIVLSAEEFTELSETQDAKNSRFDVLGQWPLKTLSGWRRSVADIPIYQEGEPDCPV
jgi:hypothetical protein